MITERDKQIIEFLKNKGEAELKTLQELFFPGNSKQFAHASISRLVKWELIKVKKHKFDQKVNVYYIE